MPNYGDGEKRSREMGSHVGGQMMGNQTGHIRDTWPASRAFRFRSAGRHEAYARTAIGMITDR